MLNSLPVRVLWHSFNWLTRIAIAATALLAVIVAVTIIVMRHWVLPDIEQQHDRMVAALSVAIGSPVSIGRIAGDWQGFEPHISLDDVRILDNQGQPALVLPRVEASLSWLSLFTLQPRLSSLEVDRPELLIRRDAQGKMFLGGVGLSAQGGDNTVANLLLRQSRMVVHNALIVWVDEQRAAPALVLENVDLRIESFWNHHRFALRAIAPSELATPLDVRGDFYGSSFDDLKAWSGQLFTQVERTDITAWRPWLDMPREFSRGRGALRVWIGVGDGGITQVTGDLALRDVVTKLADDVPELALRSLHGRADWRASPDGFELETRQLTLRLQNGTVLPATDFHLRLAGLKPGKAVQGELRANSLRLETLTSLSAYIPMPVKVREQLDGYAPRGTVTGMDVHWQGNGAGLPRFRVKAQFRDMAMRQVGALPGFSGLTGEVDGDQDSGSLRIKSRRLTVDAPGIMREPVHADTLAGEARWEHEDGEFSLKINRLEVENADLEGTAKIAYRTYKDTPGILDLTVRLKRADIRQAARYTPLVALDGEAGDWLHDALLAGKTDNLRIRIQGNLKDFPFDGDRDGVFEISGDTQGGSLRYVKEWPAIDNISGTLAMHGKRLEFRSQGATSAGVPLHNVSVVIPDISAEHTTLEVKLEADAAARDFLHYVRNSPVRGYVNGFTDSIRASGDGHLELTVVIPRLGEDRLQVFGLLRLRGNDIDMGGAIPLLRRAHGELLFTQAGLNTRDLGAEILGGPATIDVQADADGKVHAAVRGRCDLDALRKVNSLPLLDRLHGGAPWELDIDANGQTATIALSSSLQGIGSTLPRPLSKEKGASMPLRFEKKSLAEGRELITAQLGDWLHVRLAGQEQDGESSIRRGAINFGGPVKWPGQDGVWLSGSLPVLSVQGWDSVAASLADGGGQAGGGWSAPVLGGADLHIASLTGYGSVINDLHIAASRRGEGLVAQLSSAGLNGELLWQPRGFQAGESQAGKLTVSLDNLNLQREAVPVPQPVQPVIRALPAAAARPGKLPAVELAIGHLQVHGKQVGRVELVGYPDGGDWRMRRLHVTNPDGSLDGDAVWQGVTARTQLNLALNLSDTGNVLGRSGHPNTVKGAGGKLAARMSWAGSPGAFDYRTIEGTLRLDVGKGQFLKVEPGVGKLLSVLNLQALPKHIALDFTDVFSDGFQFDNINGNAVIRQGFIETRDFHIDGSAAKVRMNGSVDLNRETQDIRVEILPTLGSSVSVLGAFIAGPAIGIGTYVVDRMLGSPLDKLISFEYNISGTWSDPSVVKLGEKPVRVVAPTGTPAQIQ